MKHCQNSPNNLQYVDYYKSCGNFSKTASYFGKNKRTLSKIIKNNLFDWKNYQKTKSDRPWTIEEEEILSQYPKISLKEISKKLDRSYSCVRSKALHYGISLKDYSLSAKESARRRKQSVWSCETVLNEIRLIHKNIKTHSDVVELYPKLYDAAQRYFGSWKKALKKAGFSYDDLRNQEVTPFKSIYKSYDGNFYDSRIECSLGNFLYEMKKQKIIKNYIPHKRVCDTRHWKCDFYITFNDNEKLWVEYDGLGDYRPNKEKFNEKINYYFQNEYNIEIFKSRKKFIYFILERTDNIDQYNTWSNKRNKIRKIQGKTIDKYKKTLLNDVMNVYKQLGHVPTSTEYHKNGTYSITTLYDNIGTWRDVLESAKLWKKYKKKRLSKKEIEIVEERLMNGESVKSISKDINLSFSAIHHIYYRRFYKKQESQTKKEMIS